MKYRTLGHTNIDVSLICLGTMTWGVQNSEADAHAQLDYALEQGINFIDTAELYPVPPQKEHQGRTESFIGTWLASRKKRKDIILATKVAGPGEFIKYIRNGPRLNKSHIHAALESSLKRLQTDYIDLYQLHWPERRTNFFGQLGYHPPASLADEESDVISIRETLTALGELVQAGRVRYIGVSNETPWGLLEFLSLAQQADLPRLVSIQNPYNLLNRSFEVGLAEIAYREKAGLLAYSPLGFGALSGKYLNGAKPAGSRLSLYAKQYSRYTNPQALKATEAYVRIAQKYNLDPAQMALAFINKQAFVTSNIIGATNIKQLESNIKSAGLELSAEAVKEIDAVHIEQPNPSP